MVNLLLVFDVTAQVAVGHVRKDDHGVLVTWHTHTKQLEDVRVVEILHYHPLLQERLNCRLVQTIPLKNNSFRVK